MGNPLAPTIAKIFLFNLEEMILNNCPKEFKPLYYRRLLDDIFAVFKEKLHGEQMFDFINAMHKNIIFPMKNEISN